MKVRFDIRNEIKLLLNRIKNRANNLNDRHLKRDAERLEDDLRALGVIS